MKRTKLPKELAKNASKLHKHVGKTLQSIEALKNFEIRQEYSVKKINPDFSSGREKFDWVVLGAKIAVECHGEHHYKPIRYGGISTEEAKRKLVEQRERDEDKRSAAEEMGWTYVVVSHEETDIDEAGLAEKIRIAIVLSIVEEGIKNSFSTTLKEPKKKFAQSKKPWPKQKIPSRPFGRKKNSLAKNQVDDMPTILEWSGEEDYSKPNSCRYCAGSKFC